MTVRLRSGLPSLRRESSRAALERAFGAGAERFGFRLVHYSIQSNHLHFLVEAEGNGELARGMQALLVRAARALNKLWQRRGSVFGDRYHARALANPREVRHALVYVLCNARRHGIRIDGVDRFSSARLLADAPGAVPSATVEAQTWLLRVGWRKHGPIRFDESGRGSASRPRPRA